MNEKPRKPRPKVVRLAALRELGDVSQQELSKLAGLSPRTVGMIEGRGGTMSGSTAATLAPLLGTTTDYLLGHAGTLPGALVVKKALFRARHQYRVYNG